MRLEFGNLKHIELLEKGVAIAKQNESGKVVKIKEISEIETCPECEGAGETAFEVFRCPECENEEILRGSLYEVIDGEARCKQCLVKFDL